MRIGKQLPNVPRRLLVRTGSEDTADRGSVKRRTQTVINAGYT